MLISETASKLYHLRNPNFEKEIIKATQISGISDESVNEFIAGINQSLDIYSNYMVFYTEPGFVSPIADAGLLFYRYYLLDSAIRNGHKCYCIAFKPRRKQERAFTGEFWVADTSFAIQSITMFVNREANLNFISDLMVEDEFKPVNDSVWLISKEHIKADLNLVDWKKINGMQGDKVSIYSNYILNSPIPNNVRYKIDRVVFSDSSLKIRDWGQVRPEQLTSREKQVYMMVDSIKNVAAFRTIYDILSTIFDAHYNFGKFKIGHIFQFIAIIK